MQTRNGAGVRSATLTDSVGMEDYGTIIFMFSLPKPSSLGAGILSRNCHTGWYVCTNILIGG